MVLAQLRYGKGQEHSAVFDGHMPLSLGGTQRFSSGKGHCVGCCQKRRRGGATSYNHQMLAGAQAHPDHKAVFPLAPEMIEKEDSASKNDCERKAARRFVEDFRREHLYPKTIVIRDGLASKGPLVKLLHSKDLRYARGTKPEDHKFLFDWAKDNPEARTLELAERTKAGRIEHRFRWLNDGSPD